MKQGKFQWLIDPAKAYLKLFSNISHDAPAHKRIALWLGKEIEDAAHVGFENFIFIDPLDPTPNKIIKSLLDNKHWNTGFIFIAALAERFRKNIGFGDLSNEQLTAGLFHLRTKPVEHQADIQGLENAVKEEVKSRGLWLSILCQYIEPQLEAKLEHIDSFNSFLNDPETLKTATDLLLKWLTTISDLPSVIEIQLIDLLLLSNKKERLGEVAISKIDDSNIEKKRCWQTVRLITNFEVTKNFLDKNSIEPELLWHIRGRTSDRYGNNLKVHLTSDQIKWVIKKFRSVWPIAERPSGTTGGDRNPRNASQYLIYLIQQLGSSIDPLSITALNELQGMPVDGYTETIKSVSAEQKRKRIESTYMPTTIDEMQVILLDNAPTTITDLQEYIMEELDIAQKAIKSNDIDSWKGFFDKDGIPLDEETCSDHLIGILRQNSQEVIYRPEVHVANDKEVDITCSVGNLRLPIEVKGQWHKELWNAADSQLDHLYTKDCEAENRGIYFVLWFGEQEKNSNKRLTSPGKGKDWPKSPIELRSMLIERSSAAHEGRIEIFVLDISRNS